MKLWHSVSHEPISVLIDLYIQQASGTVKFFINFSNANKKNFVSLHKPIVLGLLNYIWRNIQNKCIGVFGFHYPWYVKTVAAADNICINLYMIRCKQYFQFAAIYSVRYGSRIQYKDSFQFERTWFCWMYCLNQSISSTLFPVFSRYCWQNLPWVISSVFSPMYTLTVLLVTRFILSWCFQENYWLSE